jgi:hypothetical protein
MTISESNRRTSTLESADRDCGSKVYMIGLVSSSLKNGSSPSLAKIAGAHASSFP